MGILVRQKNGKWYVVHREKGKAHWKPIGRGEEARQMAELTAEEARRTKAFEAAGLAKLMPWPVEIAVEEWYELHWRGLRRSTRETYSGWIKNHIVPQLGTMDFRLIEPSDFQRFAADLPSVHVARGCLSLLRSVANYEMARAPERRRIERNPCSNVGTLIRSLNRAASTGLKRRDTWTPQELLRILEIAQENEPRFYPLLLAAAHTGMRMGELFALKWSRVDYARHRIAVLQAIVRGKEGDPKSSKAREVPITHALEQVLRKLQASQRCDSPWNDPEGLVFRSRTGTPIEKTTLSRAWSRVRRLAAAEGIRPLAFHSFRHTYASMGLAASESPAQLAEWLGHSVETLLRYYVHTIPTPEARADFIPGASGTPRGTNPVQRPKRK